MRILILISIAVAVLGTTASADVLGFDHDDLPTSYPVVPDGYGGFDWDQVYYQNALQNPNSGYRNGVVSPNNVAYNASGNVATVDDSEFNFVGAYLTGAWNDGLNIKVQGYNGGSLLYETTVVVDTTGPTWFAFNYNSIDRLVFDSYGGIHHAGYTGVGDHFVMDNFTYTRGAGPPPIPAPGAALLGLLGMGLVGWVKRRLT